MKSNIARHQCGLYFYRMQTKPDGRALILGLVSIDGSVTHPFATHKKSLG